MEETLTHATDCEELGATCASCNEHACDRDNWNWTRDGLDLCEGCYESECNYLSTIIYFEPSEPEPVKYLIGDLVAFDQWGDPAPDSMRRSYVRTDAWRGYHVTEIDGTTEIDSGADLWGLETDIRTLAERIQSDYKEGILPVPVYVICDLTSNVFSVAMTVRVENKYVDAFKEYLTAE